MFATYTPDSPKPFEINDADIRYIVDAFAENDGCVSVVAEAVVYTYANITDGEKSCWFSFREIAEYVAEYVDEIRPEMREMLIRDEWTFDPRNITPEIAREILTV